VTYASYTGHETLTFPDYLDLSTGRTLTAKPGQSYDVAPASGRLVPDVPAGWFTPVDPEEWAAKRAAAEAERLEAERLAAESAASAAAEGGTDAGGEPDGSGEPGGEAKGGEPQQF
jgi:hypothetical protein